jgi:chromosome segregation ATPase
VRRLDQACKSQNVKGYLGLLADHLEISDTRFSSVVDIAAKSKLFSLFVETVDQAETILKINKELNGGVVNINPIETLNMVQKKQAMTYPQDARPILDYIRVKDTRLESLVHNIFYKVVMVRDYPTAMQYAKSHNITCVTPDLQVVYAGAFITKVGNTRVSDGGRLANLLKISSMQRELAHLQSSYDNAVRDHQEVNQGDLEALRNLQRAEVQLNYLRQDLTDANATKHELTVNRNSKQAKLDELHATLARYQQLNQDLLAQID